MAWEAWEGMIRPFWGCSMGVPWVFHGLGGGGRHDSTFWGVFHGCSMAWEAWEGMIRPFGGCSMGVPWVFQGCFMGVPWVFHGLGGVGRHDSTFLGVFHGCPMGVPWLGRRGKA